MSQYAKEIRHILATLNQSGDEDDAPLPDEEELDTIHVYPVEGGGILFTRTPIEPDESAPPIIDSRDEHTSTAAAKTPSPLVLFLLLLCVFVLGDMADTQLLAMVIPTATITIVPNVRTITLQSTAMLGKLLSPITLSQSQTVPTTGHGHQDARQATGALTFYNGLSTAQQVEAGTIITGQDGRSAVTGASITIPPANPPSLGEIRVPARAVQAGNAGNIQARDISMTLSTGLYVKNLAAFTGGQDERDYLIVTKADRDAAAISLQAKVTASITAALQGQLVPGEELQIMPCSRATTVDHAPGEEATHLTVSVSETCSAIAYDMQQLHARATQLLTTQAAQALGAGYLLSGNVRVTVNRATATPATSGVVFAFTCQGMFAYTLNGQAQQRIKSLLAGKPRHTALRLLLQQTGIHTASITGIADNLPLPDDLTHIHLLIVLMLF
jgi:Baseplate J-like protein